MHLIALLIGLVIERLATRLFHLRRLRWIDRIIDSGFRQAAKVPNWPALIPVLAIAVLLILPVLAIVLALGDALFGFPYLVLGVVVLFFSLGPQDIGEDVDEYCKAIEDGDNERVRETAKAIIESDVPEDTLDRIHRVEEAVCVQANNRLFAVIFWFVLLGPLGAWTYRVTDLVRRRAVFAATREEEQDGTSSRLRQAATVLHGWLAWIPARLTAIGYAAAGNFDTAIGAWRAPTEEKSDSPFEYNEHLLARVGTAALAIQDDGEEDLISRGVRGATAANRLVFRLLLIWAVVISAMTLYGWTQ
ncbi:MAG: regulatory signaling modulator protein AmpE [Woeseiaceae bacterium]|nr:regulatory signaling modulator protein AmpE [Woeseiaceae bacterium]NIP20468.1 regulatory signaling modulator protein AmpE [Woeseiaceae bacterium]NIS89063.1 regulatory signaling modulator protein AmpE [Woeseiaceae bacterium]